MKITLFFFEKENNPSILRSPSPGKLINLLIEDGVHVNKSQPYAEIEVMKKILTLTVQESGTISFVRRSGDVLDAGSLFGHIELDDASIVPKIQSYKYPFPPSKQKIVAEKVDKIHNRLDDTHTK